METDTKIKTMSDLLAKYKVQEKSTEKVLYPRQELIKKFVDRLNESRVASGYKPLTPAFIASKMYQSGLKNAFLLNWFFGYCNDAKNFSATWWWSLKLKK